MLFSDRQARAFCEEIEAKLPLPVTFKGLRFNRYAQRRFRLACFEYDGAAFSLLPGGELRLGFDPDHFTPTAAQAESYLDSAVEQKIEMDLRRYLRSVTTSPRRVTLAPLLVETRPGEIGLEPISPDRPEVRPLFDHFPDGNGELHADDVVLRIERRKDGSISTWRVVLPPHRQIVSDLEAQGCRLLTSDEWEYACGAGAKTLFRWGDFFPCDRYPTDNTPAERRRATIWALSGGTVPFKPDVPDWTLHIVPNLFGLEIAQTPYAWEAVAEEQLVRGGDGGVNICGGVGFFMGWLPLASAYCDPRIKDWIKEGIRPNYLRRVIPLDL